MPEETLLNGMNYRGDSPQVENNNLVSGPSPYINPSASNLVPPDILSASKNMNKGWHVNIDKLDFGYILTIGCKSISLINYLQVVSVLTNYYKFLDENPRESLESIFNSLENESKRMEFLKL